MHAKRDIATGEQVTDSYGNKPNQALLTMYGFIEPNNPDKLPIVLSTINIPKNDYLVVLKQGVLGDAPTFKLKAHRDFMSPIVQQSLSILRVILFNDVSDMDQLADRPNQFVDTKHVTPFTKKHEIKVLLEMSRIIRKSLGEYPRTLSGDLAMLRSGEVTKNQRNILSITIEEKETLTKLIETNEAIISLLLLEKEEALKKISEEERWKPVEEYLTGLLNL